VLELAKEMKLLKRARPVLTVPRLTPTPHATARSYGHIEMLETQLKAEVQELFALAESADQTNIPDGVSLPEEIKRREGRLAIMAAAKIDPLMAAARDEHHPTWRELYSEPAQTGVPHRLKTKAGGALYAFRKQTVEPVFGIIT
jgi:hypothetical protein